MKKLIAPNTSVRDISIVPISPNALSIISEYNKMELQPLELVDITSRSTGILTLISSSISGLYELREYICGSGDYKVLMRGSYTDISLYIRKNTCIKMYNLSNHTLGLTYRWEFDNRTNTLLITSIVLYIFFLLLFGICIFTCCSVGGRVLRYIYKAKLSPYLRKREEIHHISPVIHHQRPHRPLPSLPTVVHVQQANECSYIPPC